MSTFQERQAVFDSLVRKFPNKPLADTAMDEILQLRAANEALAAMVEQMRVAVAKCRFDSLNMTFTDLDYIKRAFSTTDNTSASILAERDARTLRMAAERCAELGARFYEHARAPYADCALLLLAMADELAKAGATEKKP